MEQWWPLITMAVLAVAKFVNSKTKHWSQWPWYGKIVGLLLEVLDLWRPPQVRSGAKASGNP